MMVSGFPLGCMGMQLFPQCTIDALARAKGDVLMLKHWITLPSEYSVFAVMKYSCLLVGVGAKMVPPQKKLATILNQLI